jgi:uncharacterized protein (DUF934 family)
MASTSKADYCLQNAQAAKAAGNAALHANRLREASFQYKKVYLFLAEYLPPDLTGPSSQPALHGSGNGETDSDNNGLVQMLQQRRPAASSSSSAVLTTPEQQHEMLQLYATTLNNLALVHLKLGRYREGVACATAILEKPALRAALDGAPGCTNVHDSSSSPAPKKGVSLPTSTTPAGKALLRRASCYVKLSEWAAAEADVKALMDANAGAGIAPDPACEQLTTAIRQGRKTETETEKRMMQRMFA